MRSRLVPIRNQCGVRSASTILVNVMTIDYYYCYKIRIDLYISWMKRIDLCMIVGLYSSSEDVSSNSTMYSAASLKVSGGDVTTRDLLSCQSAASSSSEE